MFENILELKNLCVGFNEKQILDNINLSFLKNKITAIIGPSGCGKSTLLKTLNLMICENIESKVSGDVLLFGENISNMKAEYIREKIGMVFQNPTPFPLSIEANMSYALKYYGVNKKKRQKIIREKLEITGLYSEIDDVLHKSALKLSGGQQQRLCIARALSIEPEILLLDEPCSALDVKSTAKIESMLLKLKNDYTIIIVTHNLAQARRIADDTIFMLDGKIVEMGKTEDVFKQPNDSRTLEYLSNN